MHVPSSTMLQLQLRRKSTPPSLCHAPLENWPMGVCRYSELLFGGSSDAERVVRWLRAGVQWWSIRQSVSAAPSAPRTSTLPLDGTRCRTLLLSVSQLGSSYSDPWKTYVRSDLVRAARIGLNSPTVASVNFGPLRWMNRCACQDATRLAVYPHPR